ncbi:hypothetical protein [Nocardioides bruguierae]|uniref:hypothetical protein n=1 Tax=Nocardioides bruguierae TaxID=2945102 RepID=UPI0020224E82|nr:hypothetical protein [Nocardioides bruguierae]MCL8025659.1 hypothetical protein [Nocardioides bruguierae]
MSQNHDESRRLRTKNFRAFVKDLEDGEFGLAFGAEIHPEDVGALEQMSGISLTMTAPLAGESGGRPSGRLLIAGNAAWFPDDALADARGVLSAVIPDVTVRRLYEYSFDPDPNVVIDVLGSAWSLIGGNLLWDAIKMLLSGRLALGSRSSASTRITIKISEGDRTSIATVESESPAAVELALKSFDKVAEQMLGGSAPQPTVRWNKTTDRWDDE